MSLKELRNKSKEPTKGSLAAMRAKNPQVEDRKKEAAGGQWDQGVSENDMRSAILAAEFDKLPAIFGTKTKIGVAAKDLVRLFTEGATFGQMDKWIGDEAETKNSQLRSGLPGVAAEVAGMVASPVTRAISAGASVFRPAAGGFMNALKSLGITAGEGGAIAATDAALNNRDIVEEAGTGAGLAAGAETTLKHIIPKPLGVLANILSKVPYKDMSDIFDIASKSGVGANAIKQTQKGKAPSKLLDAIDETKLKLESKPVPRTDEIEEALVDVFGKTTTTSGHRALDAQDQVLVNRLFDKAYGSKIDATTFNRQYLDDLIGYLEETKAPIAAEKSAGGRHVKAVHDVVKKVGSEADSNFQKILDLLDTKKTAYRVGKATSTMAPNARAFDVARDVGLATAFIGGTAALTNPVLLTSLIPMLLAASPKAVGTIARKAGSTKRNLKKVVPKGTGYGTLGLVPGASEE